MGQTKTRKKKESVVITLTRQTVINRLKTLYEEDEFNDGESPDFATMPDAELIEEYCSSGLFAEDYPKNYETEIAPKLE
ncbi:MAG TPA: hypothetical protein V6C81_07825 [Planktothrix sp.]|jgi:hypothetical protein